MSKIDNENSELTTRHLLKANNKGTFTQRLILGFLPLQKMLPVLVSLFLTNCISPAGYR